MVTILQAVLIGPTVHSPPNVPLLLRTHSSSRNKECKHACFSSSLQWAQNPGQARRTLSKLNMTGSAGIPKINQFYPECFRHSHTSTWEMIFFLSQMSFQVFLPRKIPLRKSRRQRFSFWKTFNSGCKERAQWSKVPISRHQAYLLETIWVLKHFCFLSMLVCIKFKTLFNKPYLHVLAVNDLQCGLPTFCQHIILKFVFHCNS